MTDSRTPAPAEPPLCGACQRREATVDLGPGLYGQPIPRCGLCAQHRAIPDATKITPVRFRDDRPPRAARPRHRP